MSGAPLPILPEGWPRGSGYAHGMEARGRLVCTAGQVGWDPRTQQLVAHDLAGQAAQALANVAVVLRSAGAWPEHLVRMNWYVTDRQAYIDARPAIGAAYRALFGANFPAMSVIFVKDLVEEGALIEIEATAVVPD